MLIEALVGRTPPFVFPSDDYIRPRASRIDPGRPLLRRAVEDPVVEDIVFRAPRLPGRQRSCRSRYRGRRE